MYKINLFSYSKNILLSNYQKIIVDLYRQILICVLHSEYLRYFNSVWRLILVGIRIIFLISELKFHVYTINI